MKKGRYFVLISSISLLFIIVTAFIMAGSPKEKAVEDPVKIYNDAISAAETDTGSYNVLQTENIKIGDETYIRKTDATVCCKRSESQITELYVEKQCRINDHSYKIFTFFKDNTLYTSVNGTLFSTKTSQNEAVSRNIPMELLTPTVYGTVVGIETKEEIIIQFTDALEAEKWLPEITLNKAEGTAVISKENIIKSLSYSAEFKSNAYQTQTEVTVTPLPSPAQFPVLKCDNAIEITHPDAPVILEEACGFILSSKTLNSRYSHSILCGTFGDKQTQSIQVSVLGDDPWTAGIETEVSLENTGKIGNNSHIIKSELFENGIYRVSLNNSEFEEDKTVSKQKFITQYQNILISTVMLPEHIDACESEYTDGTLLLKYIANDAFTEQIKLDACEKLYGDPDVLKNQYEDYTTNESYCYIKVDPATGIPFASGFHYAGTYTINEISYELKYTADQIYDLTDN